MIETNNLRVGNWIMDQNKYYQVQQIRYKMIKVGELTSTYTKKDKYGNLVKEEQLMPDYRAAFFCDKIPLTTDWLKKFGFEEEPLGFSINISHFKAQYRRIVYSLDYLYLREGDAYANRRDDDIITLWNMDIMKQFYVHELQNLFNSITRQELIYTP